MKHELYNAAKDSVLKHTEVDETMLLNSNKEECVDARCLLICYLSKVGMTDTEIAELTGLTRQGVGKLKASFDARRMKKMFFILWKRIVNELELNEK